MTLNIYIPPISAEVRNAHHFACGLACFWRMTK